MITVHYLNNSRAHRLVWLLEELGLAYDIAMYRRGPDLLAPPELRAVHPLGKSPVIVDGDAPPLAESGAIFQYLLQRYGDGKLVPPVDAPEWPIYLYFLHSAEGTDMPLLVNRLVFDEVKKRSPWFVRPLARAIANKLDAMLVARALLAVMDSWEGALEKSGWFAGDFSAADIMMSFPVQAAASRATALEGRPKLVDWLARIEARPAYRRALARGEFKLP